LWWPFGSIVIGAATGSEEETKANFFSIAVAGTAHFSLTRIMEPGRQFDFPARQMSRFGWFPGLSHYESNFSFPYQRCFFAAWGGLPDTT
jgi:hypothetical protein